jgi:hypothetical protein
MLSFPQAIDAAAAQRGVTAARERGACIVGAWLAGDVDASGLEAAGFERGWEPWWMTACLEYVADPDDDRVVITTEVPEYGPEGHGSALVRRRSASSRMARRRSRRRPPRGPRLGLCPTRHRRSRGLRPDRHRRHLLAPSRLTRLELPRPAGPGAVQRRGWSSGGERPGAHQRNQRLQVDRIWHR